MVDFRGRKTFQERGLMLHVEHGQSVTNRHEKIGLFSIQVLYKIISTMYHYSYCYRYNNQVGKDYFISGQYIHASLPIHGIRNKYLPF